jgi:hypothetical protein
VPPGEDHGAGLRVTHPVRLQEHRVPAAQIIWLNGVSVDIQGQFDAANIMMESTTRASMNPVAVTPAEYSDRLLTQWGNRRDQLLVLDGIGCIRDLNDQVLTEFCHTLIPRGRRGHWSSIFGLLNWTANDHRIVIYACRKVTSGIYIFF